MATEENKDSSSELYEKIAALSCSLYKLNLPKTGKPSRDGKEWTTMAAVVECKPNLKTGEKSFKVVSLGTGTKCLGQSELSESGDLVSDSHAEVLARRAFLLYLYDEVELAERNDWKSILETNKGEVVDRKAGVNKTFSLKPGVEFHFFVSHVPCGDAAIFETGGVVVSDCNDDHNDDSALTPPDCKKPKVTQNQELPTEHRTGAKLQVGAKTFEETQEPGLCRVKPGKGVPTISMSCSDKIAKWQILGLQGSLLGNFIPDPIRFSSITVGGSVPFCQIAMQRAVFDRFKDKIGKLPETTNSPYMKNYSLPHIFQSKVNFMDFDGTKNPCPGSIIWHMNGFVRVAVGGRRHGVTKRSWGKPSARVDICRKSVFEKFHELAGNLKLYDVKKITKYGEVKQLNESYTKLWQLIKSEVMIGWTEKPKNLVDFSLDP